MTDDHARPAHWRVASLANLASARLGLQLGPSRRGGTTPYVRAANITVRGLQLDDLLMMQVSESELATYALEPGDVLVAEASGSPELVGRSAIWGDADVTHVYQNTVIRIRPPASIVPEFLQAVIEDHRLQARLADRARGVGIQHLGLKRLQGLPVPLPPPAEQADIARNLTERIELLAAARARLGSALAAINAQEDEVLSLVSAGSLMDEIDAGSRREWPLTTVGAAGQAKSGVTRNPDNATGQFMIPYLRVANVHESFIDFSDLRFVNLPPYRRSDLVLEPGDIVLTQGQSANLLGRPALFQEYEMPISYQNHILRYRCSDDLDPRFALLVFRHNFRSGVYENLARGSTNIAHFTLSAFSEIPILLPPISVQKRLADRADQQLSALDKQRAAIRQSLDELPAMTKEIFAMAVRGDLASPNESGGTAAELLRELDVDGDRVERSRSTSSSTAQISPVQGSVSPSRSTLDGGAPIEERLFQLFEAAGDRGLTMIQLFPLLGLDKNRVEDVERLYLAIKAQSPSRLIFRGGAENNSIEMVNATS